MYRTSKYMDELTLEQQEQAVATMTNCVAQYNVVRKIVCAATLYSGVLLTGVRHFDPIMRTMIKRLDLDGGQYEQAQGFVDQYGVFCDRVEAMNIVLASNQPFDPVRNGGSGIELYSEGIC